MQCLKLYQKLLYCFCSLLFLTSILFIVGQSKVYALTRQEVFQYLSANKDSITSSTLKSNINYILNTTDFTQVDRVWFDSDNVVIMFPTAFSNRVWNQIYFYFINNTNSFYTNGNSIVMPRNSVYQVHYQFDINGNRWEVVSNSNTDLSSISLNNFTNLSLSQSVFLSSSNYVYINNQFQDVASYYFNSKIGGIKFYKNVNNYIDYRNNKYNLGYIDSSAEVSNVSFYLYDVTDLNNNFVVASSYNSTINVDNNYNVYVDSFLLYSNRIYDLYFIYNGQDTQIFQYTFNLSSGENYGLQDITNNLINNQNQNTQDIVNAIESGDKNITDILTQNANFSGNSISSGDILSALDMNFSGDPYENVWFTLIDGLRNSLVGVNRSFDIVLFNKTYHIDLDTFSPKLPPALKTFMAIVSSTLMVWLMIRWIKQSVDKIQTANIDKLLEQNEEEGIIDMF